MGTKRNGYISILMEGSTSEDDLKFFNSLTTEQLRMMVTREEDLEIIEDREYE